MIAPAMPSVACTTTAGIAVGMTCRHRIRGVLRAERARRLHVLELARPQHLAAHQPRVAHPADDRQREQDVRQARPEHRDERNRQQQPGKRQQHVDDPADHIVERRRRSSRRPRRAACRPTADTDDDGQADEERDARAGEHAREDVASELVEAERMRAGRTRPAAARSSCAAGSNGVSTGPTQRRERGAAMTIAAPVFSTSLDTGCADRAGRRPDRSADSSRRR